MANTEGILFDVDFTDHAFPCIQYALRRIGLHEIKAFYPLPDNFIKNAFNKDDLRIGDIVVWERSSSTVDFTLTMCNNIPITSELTFGVHAAVYEGNGFISDISFSGESVFPYIRIRLLKDISKPMWIYRYTLLKK